MTTTARGRHRKLRRNILHTVVATALLAGTFTVVDQATDRRLANAAETTGQAGELVFTTDSAASLRAIEMNADVILKGTRVDGIYTADPEKDKTATKYSQISFD